MVFLFEPQGLDTVPQVKNPGVKGSNCVFSKAIHNFLRNGAFVLAGECYLERGFEDISLMLSSLLRGGAASGCVRQAEEVVLNGKNPVSLRFETGAAADASITAADLIEISGRVKWFDAVKGYGFIVPDNGAPDVLLHIATLRKDGFKTAYEGTHVICEAVRRAKGLQVLKIVSMDGSNAVLPSEWRAPRTHVEVAPSGGFQIAIVKWFNRARGFGFLTQGDGTEDIFVHMETLRRYGIAELRPGESLLVRYGDGPKGRMAAEVRPLDAVMPAPH